MVPMHRTRRFFQFAIALWLLSLVLPAVYTGKFLYGIECLVFSLLYTLLVFVDSSANPIAISSLLGTIANGLMLASSIVVYYQHKPKAIYMRSAGWAMIILPFCALTLLGNGAMISPTVGALVWYSSLVMAGIHNIAYRQDI